MILVIFILVCFHVNQILIETYQKVVLIWNFKTHHHHLIAHFFLSLILGALYMKISSFFYFPLSEIALKNHLWF